ncbi:MAG: MarR family transcriptional regulator [Rhizobiales bacterium]|nr:MarR family transcriptional regulator [Hyphomicrobiales bacterium]
MLFKQAVLDRIAAGEIRQAFRRWQKPTVRPGGTLRTAIGVLAIDRLEPVETGDLTEADASSAGFTSIAALRAEIDRFDGGVLYRIAFHRAGDDPRLALRDQDRIDPATLAGLAAKLDALDRGSRGGAWTAQALALIASRDGMTAAEIARQLRIEKAALKIRIRKLGELGLTESLVSGYRLSPRGRAFLAGRDTA